MQVLLEFNKILFESDRQNMPRAVISFYLRRVNLCYLIVSANHNCNTLKSLLKNFKINVNT
jgi:hypothetical protein